MRARLFLGILIFAADFGPAAAQSLQAPSTWKNQRGSILTISAIDAKGHITGTYDNQAPGYPCHDTFDMQGAAAGSQISFVVVWKNSKSDCGSVTAWYGTISGTNISTSWQLAYGNPTTGKIETKTGKDQFQKQ